MKAITLVSLLGLLLAPFLTLSPIHAQASLSLTPGWIVENVGQFPPQVRFQARLDGQTLWLLEDGLWLVDGVSAVRLRFLDAAPSPRVAGMERRATRLSYWNERGLFADVPLWRGVRYEALYPGVDLVLDGAGWHWLGTPAALQAVHLALDGATLEADPARSVLRAGWRELPLFPMVAHAPDGHIIPMTLTPGADGVRLSPAPTATTDTFPDRPADLSYSTFLGGTASEGALDAAVGSDGSLYLVGDTLSPNFPTRPGSSLQGAADVFVARLKPDGSDLLYALLIGGADWELARGLTVDASGNAYVVGETYSLGFPTSAGAFDRTFNGPVDAFALKVDAAGAFVYATLLGGTDTDRAYDVAVDGSGNVYITGSTFSADFPVTAGALDASFNGDEDGFVAKLNASGSGVIYATYLGGSAPDVPHAIAVDSAGGAYVTGYTESTDFPVSGDAFQKQPASAQDAFVVRLGINGGSLVYGTYLGGSGDDEATDLALDNANVAYVVGETTSTNFPTTAGAWQNTFGGGATDGFLVKLASTGRTLAYGTYVGGSSHDRISRVVVNSSAAVYLGGHTDSSNFPVTAGAYNTQPQGGYDGFALYVNPLTNTLLYGTRAGGNDADFVYGLAVRESAIYLAGTTRSANFPVTAGAFDTSYNQGGDAFALKLTPTYALAGRVTDAQARPMADVTITVMPGNLTVQTGADGRYQLTGLAAGTYLVTPGKAGYSFTPLSRLLTLPVNVDNVDFVMAPLPVMITLQPGVARTVTLTDTLGQTTVITFPASTVTQTTGVTVALVPGQSGGGYYSPGMAFTLTALPDPGTFAIPLQAALTYAPGATGPLVDKQDLKLVYWTGSDWNEAGTTCDPALVQEHNQAARRVTAAFCRSGQYLLRGPSRQVNLPLVLRNR